MTYGTLARRVRDETLGHGLRLAAFKGCLERYSPIGWQASFDYLCIVAGPIRRDSTALVRALDLLSASRDLYLGELAAYQQHRLAAKRAGRRTPSKGGRGPSASWRWRGAERAAALFALGHDHERRTRVGPEPAGLVERCLKRNGHLDAADLVLLDRLQVAVEHYRTKGFDRDNPDWTRWHDSSAEYRLLAHVHDAAYAVT